MCLDMERTQTRYFVYVSSKTEAKQKLSILQPCLLVYCANSDFDYVLHRRNLDLDPHPWRQTDEKNSSDSHGQQHSCDPQGGLGKTDWFKNQGTSTTTHHPVLIMLIQTLTLILEYISGSHVTLLWHKCKCTYCKELRLKRFKKHLYFHHPNHYLYLRYLFPVLCLWIAEM